MQPTSHASSVFDEHSQYGTASVKVKWKVNERNDEHSSQGVASSHSEAPQGAIRKEMKRKG